MKRRISLITLISSDASAVLYAAPFCASHSPGHWTLRGVIEAQKERNGGLSILNDWLDDRNGYFFSIYHKGHRVNYHVDNGTGLVSQRDSSAIYSVSRLELLPDRCKTDTWSSYTICWSIFYFVLRIKAMGIDGI